MKRIWITGAHGFIGRHLAKWLGECGHVVSGIGHGLWPESEAAAWGVQHWLNGDINASNLQQLLHRGGAPDCIFHLAGGASVGAAVASPHEDFARTVSTTAALLDWVRLEAEGTRFVAISSAAIYGAGHLGPIGERQAGVPFSPYGHHKLMMEQLCHSYAHSFGIPGVIVRLFSVYGSWLRKQLLWDLCTKLSSDARLLELGGTGDELRDWTDIRDVVRVLEMAMNVAVAMQTNSVQVMNAGTGKGTSVREIASIVLNSWSSDASVEFNGRSRPGDPFSLVADSSLLQSLGYEWSVSVEDGVRDYVKWYRQYSRSNA
jgi:UDP-glucose 4-epimerase